MIQRYPLVFILFISSIHLIFQLGTIPLIDWDENIYAVAASQMLKKGEYLNIYINGAPFAEKPPFFLWLQALSFHLIGINEFAARLPSAIAGMMMSVVLFLFGKKIISPKFGILWSLIFLTSLMPTFLARFAIIDHTFNLFITLGVFCFYLYDRSYSLSKTGDSKILQKHIRYLFWGSLFLGFAVLTKGPLAGMITLISLGVYKLYYPHPKLNMKHMSFMFLFSVGISGSWYIMNWFAFGNDFVIGFIKFQLNSWNKPLEGHQGPFIYPFVALFLGIFPWAPFLFLIRKKVFRFNEETQMLSKVFLPWVLFVLILFGFTSSKLPHHSASVYIPITFFVSLILYERISNKKKLPFEINFLFLILAISYAAVIYFLPILSRIYWDNQNLQVNIDSPNPIFYFGVTCIFVVSISIQYLIKKKWNRVHTILCVLSLPLSYSITYLISNLNLLFDLAAMDESTEFQLSWSSLSYLTGVLLLIGLLFASYQFWKHNLVKGVAISITTILIFVQCLWKFQFPVFVSFNQEPLIEMINTAKKEGARVALYRFISFAVLFYGMEQVEMIHTSKFKGDPYLLDANNPFDLYVITSDNLKKGRRKVNRRLSKEHPRLKFVRTEGKYSLFILPRSPKN